MSRRISSAAVVLGLVLGGCSSSVAPLPTTTYSALRFNGAALPVVISATATDTVRITAATLTVLSDQQGALVTQFTRANGPTTQQVSLRITRTGTDVRLEPICGGPSVDCIVSGFHGTVPAGVNEWLLQSVGYPFPVGIVDFATVQAAISGPN